MPNSLWASSQESSRQIRPSISIHQINSPGGNKRRPVDPEETGSSPTTTRCYGYDSEAVAPNAKRPRTIDDVLGSLSLRPPDPPGNICKRKSYNEGVEVENNGPSAKVARASAMISASASSTFDENSKQMMGEAVARQQQLDPEGSKGESPTNVTSALFDMSTQQQPCTSRAPNISVSNNNMNTNEMAIDESSDHESDSSVSEGSIRNAMYQLVFGRKNHPPSLNNPVANGRYDTVDSKIEDLIRRSRLEAAIKSKKKESDESGMEMDMDMDEDDDDETWIPGHG